MKLFSAELRNRQALLSVVVLALLVLTVLLLLSLPWQAKLNAYNFELQRDARHLQQLLAVEAVRPELDQVGREFRDRGLESWVYSNPSASAIQLDIQRRITEIITASGANINTVAPLAVRGRDGDDFFSIGVRVRFSGSLEQVYASLREMELSTPLLLIDDLRMAPLGARSPRESRALQTLDVQMSVAVLMPAATVEGEG